MKTSSTGFSSSENAFAAASNPAAKKSLEHYPN